MTVLVQQVIDFFDEFAPLELAEDWDNVGLLIGDPQAEVSKILTCLTVTPDVVSEAIETGAGLIVSHHPMMFRPVKKITTQDPEGEMLLKLISNRIAVYSPHTAFDSASQGINQRLAESLGLTSIRPLRTIEGVVTATDSGSGRWGKLPSSLSLEQFLVRVKKEMKVSNLKYAGDPTQPVTTVGIACGAAFEYFHDARRVGCDLFLTGEARFHNYIEARTLKMPLVVAGHYATERPAVEELAETLTKHFPDLSVLASLVEADPVQWSLS